MIFVKLNIQRFAEGSIVIETRVDNSKLKEDLKKAEDSLEFWAKRKEELLNKGASDEIIAHADESISFWESRIKKLKEQLSGESITPKIATEGMEQASNMLDTIGNKSTNILSSIAGKILGIGRTGVAVIKAITKALATSGILLIIMAILLVVKLIADAFKRVTDQNEELKNKIEYLKFVLKTMYDNILKPIVNFLAKVLEKLVNFIFRVLSFIGGIIKAITNKNIFENTGIKDFEKSLKDSNKSAKELKKTLVGFDEANILNGGSTGVGVASSLKGLDDLPNLFEETEKKASKIREWFTRPLTKENIMKVVNSFTGAFNIGYNWLKENIFNPGIGYIRQMIHETEPLWGPVWNTMKTAFTPAIEKMKQTWNTFKEYLKPVQAWADKLFEPVRNAWNTMLERYLKPAWQSFYNSLPQPVQDALNKIWDKFKKLYNDIAFYLNNIGIHIAYITDTTETEVGETTKKVKQNVGEINSQVNKLSGAKINITTNTSSINKLKDILDDIVYNVQILTGKNVITTTTWTTKANKKSAKGSIIYPKLAMGGIVNMPGRGIPYGGATIAERGAEAVLPLTDSQQMQLLGEAIGKFVTINATIPVYAYNRQVDRQIQKIQNQQDMVMNR